MRKSFGTAIPTDVRTESPWRGSQTGLHLMRGGVLLVVLAIAFSIPVCCNTAIAGETVYDNLDPLLSTGERIYPESGNWFLAQPFEIGQNTNVSSFSINLSRWGSPSGRVHFSVWDDTAAGLPGQEVSDLGTVDASLLEDVGTQPETLPTITFDSSVTGLVPQGRYYVVADMRELEGGQPSAGRTVLFGGLRSSEGTNGAGEMILSNPFVEPPFSAADWVSTNTIFGESRYLQMSIESMPSGVTNTVFDNLAAELDPNPDYRFNNALGTDRRFAQQFLMDDHNSVDEVTVSLIRQGSPSGNMTFEIWSDNGRPDEKIAELGTIMDVSQIPTVHTIFTFDRQITGLVPDEPYWVVANYSGLNPPLTGSKSIGWTAVLSDEGAAGAVNAHGSRDSGQTWDDFAQIFHDTVGGRPFMFKMAVSTAASVPELPLQAGDADQDLDFDQIDLVKVQVAAKYLTGQPATWGEGDWNGAPGGSLGNPPAGNGLFDQVDVVAALGAGIYLTGPYAAVQPNGHLSDGQTSVIYNAATGELAIDAPSGAELTSINIDSASDIFTGETATNLGGSFDNDADVNIFKATFGSSFGSMSFGNVAQAALSEEFVLNDLSVVGSLAGGGDLGPVDLVYVPEPTSLLLLSCGLAIGLVHLTPANR